jgi:hypothetical protein
MSFAGTQDYMHTSKFERVWDSLRALFFVTNFLQMEYWFEASKTTLHFRCTLAS